MLSAKLGGCMSVMLVTIVSCARLGLNLPTYEDKKKQGKRWREKIP